MLNSFKLQELNYLSTVWGKFQTSKFQHSTSNKGQGQVSVNSETDLTTNYANQANLFSRRHRAHRDFSFN